ncbi:hypothetical protein [Spartinivicinus poritis]|uniref:Uncharacterized protein n=1 Tax=Spartinivicinus poritis TaxID=2994640 RepID=A0ABT5UHF5_9GAMM|nr:hypothetical protein [Spartinivicinus sp. A2-2]MDE1465835.1 hypothetical protein [Spartinivicinus sp. A2-2]
MSKMSQDMMSQKRAQLSSINDLLTNRNSATVVRVLQAHEITGYDMYTLMTDPSFVRARLKGAARSVLIGEITKRVRGKPGKYINTRELSDIHNLNDQKLNMPAGLPSKILREAKRDIGRLTSNRDKRAKLAGVKLAFGVKSLVDVQAQKKQLGRLEELRMKLYDAISTTYQQEREVDTSLPFDPAGLEALGVWEVVGSGIKQQYEAVSEAIGDAQTELVLSTTVAGVSTSTAALQFITETSKILEVRLIDGLIGKDLPKIMEEVSDALKSTKKFKSLLSSGAQKVVGAGLAHYVSKFAGKLAAKVSMVGDALSCGMAVHSLVKASNEYEVADGAIDAVSCGLDILANIAAKLGPLGMLASVVISAISMVVTIIGHALVAAIKRIRNIEKWVTLSDEERLWTVLQETFSFLPGVGHEAAQSLEDEGARNRQIRLTDSQQKKGVISILLSNLIQDDRGNYRSTIQTYAKGGVYHAGRTYKIYARCGQLNSPYAPRVQPGDKSLLQDLSLDEALSTVRSSPGVLIALAGCRDASSPHFWIATDIQQRTVGEEREDATARPDLSSLEMGDSVHVGGPSLPPGEMARNGKVERVETATSREWMGGIDKYPTPLPNIKCLKAGQRAEDSKTCQEQGAGVVALYEPRNLGEMGVTIHLAKTDITTAEVNEKFMFTDIKLWGEHDRITGHMSWGKMSGIDRVRALSSVAHQRYTYDKAPILHIDNTSVVNPGTYFVDTDQGADVVSVDKTSGGGGTFVLNKGRKHITGGDGDDLFVYNEIDVNPAIFMPPDEQSRALKHSEFIATVNRAVPLADIRPDYLVGDATDYADTESTVDPDDSFTAGRLFSKGGVWNYGTGKWDPSYDEINGGGGRNTVAIPGTEALVPLKMPRPFQLKSYPDRHSDNYWLIIEANDIVAPIARLRNIQKIGYLGSDSSQ